MKNFSFFKYTHVKISYLSRYQLHYIFPCLAKYQNQRSAVLYMFILILSIACRYHIQIQTTPAPADVIIRDIKYTSKKIKQRNTEQSQDDHLDIRLWKMPLIKIPITINAYGYRTLEQSIHLQRSRVLFPRINQYHFLLISDHDSAGSWSPEDPLDKP